MKVTVYFGKMDGTEDVRGDYLMGSYLTGANVMGNRVRILGFDPNSKNQKINIKNLMLKFNAKGTILEIGSSIEILPILAVTATFACSDTKIYIDKEKIEDSIDLINATVKNINAVGGEAFVEEYGVLIKGKSILKGGGEVDAQEDVRLAMAFIFAGTVAEEKITIKNLSTLNIIYPDFFERIKNLGANIIVQ